MHRERDGRSVSIVGQIRMLKLNPACNRQESKKLRLERTKSMCRYLLHFYRCKVINKLNFTRTHQVTQIR